MGRKTGLAVLLSVHGAPGSQNGAMHSGRQGTIGWHTDPANIAKTLQFVERLARRYKTSPAFKGIGLLNEPAAIIPKTILRRYYKRAYRLVRRHCGRRSWVVITDIYKPEQWHWSMRWPWYRQVYVDSHQYQIFTEAERAMPAVEHARYTRLNIADRLYRLRRGHRVIVGEWCAALDPRSLAGLELAVAARELREFAWAQQAVYGHTDGWFFWNYRHDTAPQWSFRSLVERGDISLQ